METNEAKPGEALQRDSVLAAVEMFAANQPQDIEHPDDVTLSTGIIVEVVRAISYAQLMDINERFPDPPVPMVPVQGQDREVPNPTSPTYQAALRENATRKAFAALDAVTMMCTQVKFIPKGMFGPDDDEWIEMLEEMDKHPKTAKGRYVLWMRYYAAPSSKDMERVTSTALRKMGVREEDVLGALNSFPDQSEGTADQPSNPEG